MNPVEQKIHTKRTAELASALVEHAEAASMLADETRERFSAIEQHIDDLRVALADVRMEIDAERLDRTDSHEKLMYVHLEACDRIWQAFDGLRYRTFWQRLRWLLMGY